MDCRVAADALLAMTIKNALTLQQGRSYSFKNQLLKLSSFLLGCSVLGHIGEFLHLFSNALVDYIKRFLS